MYMQSLKFNVYRKLLYSRKKAVTFVEMIKWKQA